MNDRPGCLTGLGKLFILDWVFDFLQKRFGFGRGCSGCGCGLILLLIFIILASSVIFSTDWTQIGF